MSRDNVRVVRQIFEAFRRDWAVWNRIITPTSSGTTLLNSPDAGVHHGVGGITAWAVSDASSSTCLRPETSGTSRLRTFRASPRSVCSHAGTLCRRRPREPHPFRGPFLPAVRPRREPGASSADVSNGYRGTRSRRAVGIGPPSRNRAMEPHRERGQGQATLRETGVTPASHGTTGGRAYALRTDCLAGFSGH